MRSAIEGFSAGLRTSGGIAIRYGRLASTHKALSHVHRSTFDIGFGLDESIMNAYMVSQNVLMVYV
jgi:hypothetical protein